jgi:hypothetical protein
MGLLIWGGPGRIAAGTILENRRNCQSSAEKCAYRADIMAVLDYP